MSDGSAIKLGKMKAHCPRCDGERVCDVHGLAVRPWDWTDGPNSAAGCDTHRLLECRGCETVFYHRLSWDDQDLDPVFDGAGNYQMQAVERVETYPQPEKKARKPDWVWSIAKKDPQLEKILSEVYDAVERRSNILAATGLRTAFDRVVSYHAVDENLPLAAKVKALKERGFIGETEADILNTVVDAGSAAAHRAWNPTDEQLGQLLQSLEHFIHRTVVVGEKVLEVKALIPGRNK